MKANASTHHIFGEPGPAVGSNIDANADLVKGGAVQVDPVPAGNRLVSHAFLNGVDASPGSRIRSRQADTFCAVSITGIAFISDALEWRTAIRASMVKAAVIHVPAMEKCARSQGAVPGERRQTTGGPFMVDQLEELLGELLGFCGDRGRPIGSRQGCSVLWRSQGHVIAESYTVRDGRLCRGRDRGPVSSDVWLRRWNWRRYMT